MTNLVNITDLASYKYVADSVKNSAVWPQYVQEAQMFDIKWWLGDALLNEIMGQAATSPESYSAANTALLDGGSYVYNDRTYLFQGLKACIIYYAFARFTSRQPYNYTAVGLTVKDSELSTPASDKAVQRLSTEAKLQGDAIKDELIMFLRRNYATYPLWNNCGTKVTPRTFTALGD